MRRFLWIAAAFCALAVPTAVLAGSGGNGFDGVVNSLESRYHAHATRIPFMGLVSLVAHGATHQGVGNLHVAEFDDFHATVDGDELNRIVTARLGEGWSIMVRETSRKGNEQTLVFSRPEGHRMGLFVVDLDGHEMDVVQVSVDPDHLSQFVNDKTDHHGDENTHHDDSSNSESD
ncbi:MAG TPA: hypothetical protein VFU68_06185 [Terracidiphilus sp.]|nr:hypothetical protein [Terracidiphilus sp.]